MPDNWTALTDAARQRLRQKHAKEARKHEIKMWRTRMKNQKPALGGFWILTELLVFFCIL